MVSKNSIVRQIRRLLSPGKCYLAMTRTILGRLLHYWLKARSSSADKDTFTCYQINKVSFQNVSTCCERVISSLQTQEIHIEAVFLTNLLCRSYYLPAQWRSDAPWLDFATTFFFEEPEGFRHVTFNKYSDFLVANLWKFNSFQIRPSVYIPIYRNT